MENPELSIVIPFYNAEKVVLELYSRLVNTLTKITNNFEIIMINDNSPQNDWNIILDLANSDKRVIGLNLSKNFGQHAAITAGLDNSSGKWVVVMDCDLQDQPEEILKLYEKANCGFDIVVGKRIHRKDFFLKKLFSFLFYKILEKMTDIHHDSTIANFGIYSRRVIDSICMIKESHRFFPLFVRWVGFDYTEIEINHSIRRFGKSSYSFKKRVNLAIDSIVSYTDLPLKISIQFGIMISGMSFIIGLFFLIRYFFYSIPVEGWTSLMVSMFFLFGILFLIIGFFGLYIGKIFNETKKRPIYIIKEKVNI